MVKLENNYLIRPIQKITPKHCQLLLTADPSRKVINSYLNRSHQFEMIRNQQLIGVLLLLDTRPETVEVINLAVIEAMQNQGFGERLIQFAISWAKKHHYKTITIGTGNTSFAQLYLYQKCGFRAVSIDSNFFVEHYDEPIIENNLHLRDMVRLKLTLI